MSYFSLMGGSAGFGGFGYHSLGADYPIHRRSSSTQELQRELVRLRFLQPDETRFGVDGIWGSHTAGAVLHAARYVGWTGAPFTPSNADQLRSGTATVPDDLLTRLRAAQPAPPGTPGAVSDTPATPENGAPAEPGPESTSIGPHLDRPLPEPQENGQGWIPAAVIGGGVLLVGGLVWWQMARKPKPKRAAVRANRRRRRRRR